MKVAILAMAFLFLMQAKSSLAHDDDEKCDLDLSVSNVNLIWSSALPTQQLMLTVTKKKKKNCDFYVTFSKGCASDYNRIMKSGPAHLRYQLYKDASLANVLKEKPEAVATNQVLTGSFSEAGNQSQVLTYYFNIPLDEATKPTLKPSGVYMDQYLVKVYSGRIGRDDDSPEDTASVQVATIVPKNVQISFASSGGAFDPTRTSQLVDFGTLTEGASREFDMRALTNAGYSISFSSLNDGVLKHSSPGVSTVVPYTLTVNSVRKNLSGSRSSPVIVASGTGQTSQDGVANPVRITIDSVADTVAGRYSDYITVTATATE